ncbi:hypothetical protein I4U23_000951 [Adineta vaga]|nr:hypothetical protein I4U23_000951 [Adineta vaga]
MTTNSMNNIEDPITDLNVTQLVPEKIITDIKNTISEELAKAEKEIEEEIQNHFSTKKRLIDIERTLNEQIKRTMDQQKEII